MVGKDLSYVLSAVALAYVLLSGCTEQEPLYQLGELGGAGTSYWSYDNLDEMTKEERI